MAFVVFPAALNVGHIGHRAWSIPMMSQVSGSNRRIKFGGQMAGKHSWVNLALLTTLNYEYILRFHPS